MCKVPTMCTQAQQELLLNNHSCLLFTYLHYYCYLHNKYLHYYCYLHNKYLHYY